LHWDAVPLPAGAQSVLDQLAAIGTDIASRNVSDCVDLGIIEGLKQDVWRPD
jgi:hypothetical protein